MIDNEVLEDLLREAAEGIAARPTDQPGSWPPGPTWVWSRPDPVARAPQAFGFGCLVPG